MVKQLLEEVSPMVKEVDYTEAKAFYNLSKKLYADKLPSELTNTCIVALVSLNFIM